MDLNVTRVTVDITELLQISLHLLQQPHHILHGMLHLTELNQCTSQLGLTSQAHITISVSD